MANILFESSDFSSLVGISTTAEEFEDFAPFLDREWRSKISSEGVAGWWLAWDPGWALC